MIMFAPDLIMLQATKAERRKEAEEQRNKMTSAMQPGNQRVVIDLDFEGMMPEGDLRSLCQQLSYSYSSNKRAAKPLHLHFLGFKGSVAELSAKLVTGVCGRVCCGTGRRGGRVVSCLCQFWD